MVLAENVFFKCFPCNQRATEATQYYATQFTKNFCNTVKNNCSNSWESDCPIKLIITCHHHNNTWWVSTFHNQHQKWVQEESQALSSGDTAAAQLPRRQRCACHPRTSGTTGLLSPSPPAAPQRLYRLHAETAHKLESQIYIAFISFSCFYLQMIYTTKILLVLNTRSYMCYQELNQKEYRVYF